MDQDDAGDPVCWLHHTCPECGALPTEDEPGHCWRCGAALPAEDDDPATPRKP